MEPAKGPGTGERMSSNKLKIWRKNKPVEVSGRLLARNTVLNFIGQAVPLLVGVITIPFIVRWLGKGRFGLLSSGRGHELPGAQSRRSRCTIQDLPSKAVVVFSKVFRMIC